METEIESSDTEQRDVEAAITSVGLRLKEERERQGFTEKQIADRLHITMHYVRSIETDGYDKLPGIVFARGYIKSYALLLGLDKDELVAQFDSVVAVERPPESRTFIRPGPRSKKQNQALIWLLIAVLAFLAGFLVFWTYDRFFAADSDDVAEYDGDHFNGTAVVPGVGSAVLHGLIQRAPSGATGTRTSRSASTTSTIHQVEQSLLVGSSADQSLVSREQNDIKLTEVFPLGSGQLQVTFKNQGWIAISGVDAAPIYRDLHPQGDVLRITGRAPFDVLLGDAGSVSIKLNQLDVPVTDNIRIDNTARLQVGI